MSKLWGGSGIQMSLDASKRLLIGLLLGLCIISLVVGHWLERQQVIVAAETQQKAKQVKTWYEFFISAKQIGDSTQEINADYFIRANKLLKQIDKNIDSDKLNSTLEKLVGEKVKSDQHVRAKLIVLRDSLKQLTSNEKLLVSLSTGIDSLKELTGEKGLLNVDRIRKESPYRKIAETLPELTDAGYKWQANSQDTAALNKMMASLKVLAEQKNALDALASGDKFNPRQAEIYKALKKIPLYVKSADYVQAVEQFIAARTKVAELTQDRNGIGSYANSLEALSRDGNQTLMLQVSQILTLLSLLAALVVNFTYGKRNQYGGIDESELDEEKWESLKDAHDILPYTQIALNQIADLGGKVLVATKRFHGVLADENSVRRKKIQELPDPSQIIDAEIAAIKVEIVALREQAIQLGLHNSGMPMQMNLSEQSMRLNTVVEHLELALGGMSNTMHQVVSQKYHFELQDASRISRDSEGLILALTQLQRQIERMEGVLEEMGAALDKVVHGAIPEETTTLTSYGLGER
ncbi:hypothetical protein [Polynucleobacter corsicus]|uniref:hypothetical protein n=1 Tax=Polynucleobacter corsicus TaxID=2081042 RepID=UPI001BFE4FD7|nr:hypothetical protein [Polynucleobacter corsicus]QWE19295.1 hypothetical protein C2747_03455 [Polynucleobacter corsicus]